MPRSRTNVFFVSIITALTIVLLIRKGGQFLENRGKYRHVKHPLLKRHKPYTIPTLAPKDWLKYLSKNKILNETYTEYFTKFIGLDCPEKGKNLTLLIIVHSAPNHFSNRFVIRNTWASYPMKNVKILFLIGFSNNTPRERKLKRENKKYHDMIRFNLLDGDENQTYKTVAMLEWIIKWCTFVKFVIKVDDNVFVNIPAILRRLKNHTHDKRKIFGGQYYNSMPLRYSRDRTHLSRDEYSGTIYPSYISGSFYIMTSDVVKDLYKTALRTPYFKIEDIFLTGFVRMQHSDIKLVNIAKSMDKFDVNRGQKHEGHELLAVLPRKKDFNSYWERFSKNFQALKIKK